MCGILFCISFDDFDLNKIINKSEKIKHRGPDETQIRYFKSTNKNITITTVFHRLAIMDVSHSAMQPFEHKGYFCLINGEIFNYKDISNDLILNGWKPHSNCDCEVILPLFNKLGDDIFSLCQKLDGEYFMIIYDSNKDLIYIATDELSIRPGFVSISDKSFIVSSEAKSLVSNTKKLKIIQRVPSASYTKINISELLLSKKKYQIKWNSYFDLSNKIKDFSLDNYQENFNNTIKKIKNIIKKNVESKLHVDREFAFLLSGGIDSSLVCSIAAKLLKKNNIRIKTFTIGIIENKYDSENLPNENELPEDILAARKVASFIGSDHCELYFRMEDAFNVIPEVVRIAETWDETTIRASVPMYLGVKKIKELYPNIAVIFSGEVADELLGGYLYFRGSPSTIDNMKERIKLLKNIHFFDGLRADRMVAAHGCELRLPFFSKNILTEIFNISPSVFDPKTWDGIEKYVLRKAFVGYLPENILWRTKQALSDATSNKSTWKQYIKDNINKEYHMQEIEWYKYLFFSYYKGYEYLIPYKWMPNKEWFPEITDSSATALPFHTYT
jgi:asparagine synthase (glutamine-hydrolysing)